METILACSEKTKLSRMANYWIGYRELAKRWLDSSSYHTRLWIRDGVGNEEPSDIFKSGGDKMGFVYGKTIFIACWGWGQHIFFCKGPDHKYFRLCGSSIIRHVSRSEVLLSVLWHESSHRRCVNKWAWLCSNEILLTKTSCGPDLAWGAKFVDPWIRRWWGYEWRESQ